MEDTYYSSLKTFLSKEYFEDILNELIDSKVYKLIENYVINNVDGDALDEDIDKIKLINLILQENNVSIITPDEDIGEYIAVIYDVLDKLAELSINKAVLGILKDILDIDIEDMFEYVITNDEDVYKNTLFSFYGIDFNFKDRVDVLRGSGIVWPNGDIFYIGDGNDHRIIPSKYWGVYGLLTFRILYTSINIRINTMFSYMQYELVKNTVWNDISWNKEWYIDVYKGDNKVFSLDGEKNQEIIIEWLEKVYNMF